MQDARVVVGIQLQVSAQVARPQIDVPVTLRFDADGRLDPAVVI